MKKKTDKVKILSHTEISETLKKQQETVGIVDQYIRCTPLCTKNTPKSEFYANFVMQHIFVNIRNSYQDGIVLSQGLINSSSIMYPQRYHTQIELHKNFSLTLPML